VVLISILHYLVGQFIDYKLQDCCLAFQITGIYSLTLATVESDGYKTKDVWWILVHY